MSTRRDFFKVLFAAGVATAVPVLASEQLPTIYGDGIHDDTEGLQAALDGRDFISKDSGVRVEDGRCVLIGGVYRITKTLNISRKGTHIIGSYFEMKRPVLRMDSPMPAFHFVDDGKLGGLLMCNSVVTD